MSNYLPLSDQLNILIENVVSPVRRPYHLQEISEATGISTATLSQLRTGKNDNPQLATLRALCQFFNVPLRYFETTSREECLAILTESRNNQPAETGANPEISEIALRAVQLSPNSRKNLLTLLKWVEASERAHMNGEIPPPLLEAEDGE
jgi:transcriptional regulator with XRE-family HTH domain